MLPCESDSDTVWANPRWHRFGIYSNITSFGSQNLQSIPSVYLYTVWAKNRTVFFRIDNFATVNGRKVCDVKIFGIFCRIKSIRLAFQYIAIVTN